ncbi:MAG: M15 family metallopeptidase [Candidatus Colwellbacteria bacterium]|nr:M15 family metallopeptidase [Candidatus Colwellbacteria bacterium]
MVYLDEYELAGSNFYWNRLDTYDLTRNELIAIGIENDRVMVHEDIITPLIEADKKFRNAGYRIYIKDGFRSKELYELIYKKRVNKFGKEATDKLLNMSLMPHSTGRSVDVSLIDIRTGKEPSLRNGKDGIDAVFVDFYKNKKDETSIDYQNLQELLINTMENHGFRLGSLREYFHFDYRPETDKNY